MNQWFENLQSDIKNASNAGRYEEIFWKSAKDLLFNYHIECEKSSFNIVEIEFYYFDKKLHPDCYTHCHDIQKNTLQWYLHRGSNGGIKNGNRKGIDITIGNGVDVFGGVLIRSLQDSEGNIITGPSLSVDAIIKAMEIQDVHTLENQIGNTPIDKSALRVVAREDQHLNYVYRGPRIGLSGVKPFKDTLYRFTFLKGKIPDKEKLAKIAICKDNRDKDFVRSDLGYSIKVDCNYES